MSKTRAQTTDVYAEIAKQCRSRWDRGLVEPHPEPLPDKTLPLKLAHRVRPLRRPADIDSPEKLQRELERQRRRHERFLRDFAPALASKRRRVHLDAFQWREQTPDDLRDFTGFTLGGRGTWKKVHIPHYGPPTGKAVTYYRTTFTLKSLPGQNERLFMCFKGVDYKARVFINGCCLGEHEGFFAPFEFDFTSAARRGRNTLVVQVENDFICMGNPPISGCTLDGDKLYASTGCGWDDPNVGWHHCPPGMGIYQEVFYEIRNTVHISDVFIRPLANRNLAEAWLEITNCRTEPQKISVELSIFGKNFKNTVLRSLTYSPSTLNVAGRGDLPKPDADTVQELLMGGGVNYLTVPLQMPKDFRTWSPDTPWLYDVHVKLFDDRGRRLDTARRHFGMRSFRMEEEVEPRGRLYLNETPIRLRGANTMGHLQQCVMKKDWDQLRDDILLAKISGMNFFRLTQRPVQPEIYDYCDRLGMMTQTDLPLFACLRRNQFHEAVRQAHDMEKLIRCHPCNIMVSYINEPFPNAQGKPHRHLVRAELEEFFRSADTAVRLLNPERVIKAVDGDYDPPAPGLPDLHCYPGWYTGHGIDLGKLHRGYWQGTKPGWLYACGEFGSEGLDPVQTMRKYYPKSWLPASAAQEMNWNPDSIVYGQTGRFHSMWFDSQQSLEDWVNTSQIHQEWVTRIMTEAFRRDRRMVSFALHLLIDAFPAGWMKAVMDVDRTPKRAYFAYRNALAPLAVQARTDKFACFAGRPACVELWICNDTQNPYKGAKLHYQVLRGGKPLMSGSTSPDIPLCSSQFQGFVKFTAPQTDKREELLVRLALADRTGRILAGQDLPLSLFAPVETAAEKIIYLAPGNPAGLQKLVKKLSLRTTGSLNRAETILIENLQAYRSRKTEIDKAVQSGALAVFFELPEGEHTLAGETLFVQRCAMGPRHFLSRATGHPIVQDFRENDFRFWYDAEAGYITPMLKTTFTAGGYTPILASGNPDANGKWIRTLACAEKPFGKGMIRVNQFSLTERVDDNPAAMLFARRLLRL